MKKFLLMAASALLQACGGGGSTDATTGLHLAVSPTASVQCSRSAIESHLDVALQRLPTDVEDFTFYLEDINGDFYEFNRGDSTLQTPYASASTSKWVTAAVIMQLVDVGLLRLDDRPSDLLDETAWPLPESSPLNDITLRQLLNFTSGLTSDALCTHLPDAEFFQCIGQTVLANADSEYRPGSHFYYGSAHLQVAGAMAVKALDEQSWANVFANFKSLTGLFPNSRYNLPSSDNPRLAGGMTWTGEDYVTFIRAFRDVDFYTSDMVINQITRDQLADATIDHSPALDSLGEDWHYGYGLWTECHQRTFSRRCQPATQVSSPGAYGAYPFLNTRDGYFGLIARQGPLGSFREGYALFDQVRGLVESWASCPR